MKERIWAMVVVGMDGITPTIIAGCPLVTSLLRGDPQTGEEAVQLYDGTDQLLTALALEDPPGEGLWLREGAIEPTRAQRLGALAPRSKRADLATLRYHQWQIGQSEGDREITWQAWDAGLEITMPIECWQRAYLVAQELLEGAP